MVLYEDSHSVHAYELTLCLHAPFHADLPPNTANDGRIFLEEHYEVNRRQDSEIEHTWTLHIWTYLDRYLA